LQGAQQAGLHNIAEMLVQADEPSGPCPRCGKPMRVRKTTVHGGATLAHGRFRVRETEHICEAGCTEPPIGAGKLRPIVRRQSSVAEILPPRATVGYDVMVFVGLQRFVHYRDRDAIRRDLTERYGITLSTGEVSTLARSFLIYLEALHEASAPQLRRALNADGGWPLHIDATGEDGRGTLFVAYAGWRGWALGAWKIPTERADAMLPRLRAVEALFGPPCAVMRDLGRAVTEAARPRREPPDSHTWLPSPLPQGHWERPAA